MGPRVALVLAVLAATAHAAPGKPWSIAPPAGWADHSPLASQETSVDEMKTKLAAVGGSYDLALYETDPENRLTVLYMVVPGEAASGASRIRNWESGARKGVNGTAKEISYKKTETDQLVVVDQVNQSAGKTFHSVRLIGLDAKHALVGVQASCAGPETACGPALVSLRLDTSTFGALKKTDGNAIGDDEASQISYRVGFMVGVAFVLIVVVAGIQFVRRRSRPTT